MSRSLTVAFFGSSLVSAYWNGAATYYRGIIRALAGRGHATPPATCGDVSPVRYAQACRVRVR